MEGAAEQILADTGLSNVSLSPNAAYDSTMNQNINREVLPMAICMVLVFASGYLIIYNIFQISVASDIRFYGRLKTLGTTKRQLKKMIYGQANRLSLIGIPIGLVIGYLLGAVLVPVMITGTTGEAKTAVNPYIFIGSALFAYLTVLISCMKPAKIAGKVSPMEALRYTDAGTNSKRKTKKSTGGASIPKMALANLGRNKKRTITVICSLTLGLVLLSCVYAKNASFDIDKYMSQTVISDFEVEDSSISSTFGTYNPYGTTISPELVQNIEGLSGLEATGRLYSQVFTHKIGASALENIQTYYNADDRLTYIEATDAGLAEAYHDMIDSGECISILYGIDGLILDTFAQDGRMLDGTFDKGKFLSGGYVVMEAATGAEDSGKETQPTYSVGDTVELNGQQYEVMAIVADIPTITEGVNSSTQDFLSFYLPADTFRAMYPDNTLRKLFFDVVEEYQPQAEEMLIQYQQDVDKSLNYTAKSTLIEHYQEQTRANTVMGFAISLIIAFVGILNFVNSMVTAIVSRQKEKLFLACTDLCTDWTGILADSGCSDCWHLCKRGCGVQLCRSVWDSQYQLRRGNGYIGRHPGCSRFWTAQCVLPDDFLPALRSLCSGPSYNSQGIRQYKVDAVLGPVPVGCGLGCYFCGLSCWTFAVRYEYDVWKSASFSGHFISGRIWTLDFEKRIGDPKLISCEFPVRKEF